MKMVNSVILGILLATTACSGGSVPDRDEIEAMLAAGEINEAEEAVRVALDKAPGDPGLILLRSRIALAGGNPDLAISLLPALLEDARLGTEARVELARGYLMSGQDKRALETLGEGPDKTALGFAVRAGAYSQRGDLEAAGQFLTQGLAKFPDSPDLLVLAGDRELALGDVAAARAHARKALAAAPKDVQALLLAGRIAMIERRFAEADKHFDSVLAMRPQFQTALLAKAAIALDRGENDKAREILERASETLGGSAPAITYYRAQMAFDAGKIDEAHKLLQSMGDTRDFLPATMLEGLVAARRGQPEQAIVKLRHFLERGEDGRARMALALALAEVGADDDALATIRPLADAANATPQVLDAAAQLADAPVAARYRARAAKARQDTSIGPELAKADAAISAGNWKAADAIYTRVLRANPQTDNVVLLNNAAFTRLELGDAAGAVRLGRRALALAPADPIVLDTVGWSLYQAQGPSAEALDMLRRAASALPNNQRVARHASVVARAMQQGTGA